MMIHYIFFTIFLVIPFASLKAQTSHEKASCADIHKNSIVATIVTTDKCGISQYQQKTFSTINSDILRFHDWLIEHHCMFVWNPQESNGFLFLITSNMTSMYALPISSMLRPSKAKRLFPMQVLPMFCPTPLAKQQPKS